MTVVTGRRNVVKYPNTTTAPRIANSIANTTIVRNLDFGSGVSSAISRSITRRTPQRRGRIQYHRSHVSEAGACGRARLNRATDFCEFPSLTVGLRIPRMQRVNEGVNL